MCCIAWVSRRRGVNPSARSRVLRTPAILTNDPTIPFVVPSPTASLPGIITFQSDGSHPDPAQVSLKLYSDKVDLAGVSPGHVPGRRPKVSPQRSEGKNSHHRTFQRRGRPFPLYRIPGPYPQGLVCVFMVIGFPNWVFSILVTYSTHF